MSLTIYLLIMFIAHALAITNGTYLRATVLVTNSHNNSALQCWESKAPASVSSDAGTSGSATFPFPQTDETIYTVIPPRFDGGIHRAPKAQYVHSIRQTTRPSKCNVDGRADWLSSFPAWHTSRFHTDVATAALTKHGSWEELLACCLRSTLPARDM